MEDKKINANADEFLDAEELMLEDMDGVAGGTSGITWDDVKFGPMICPNCNSEMSPYRRATIENGICFIYKCDNCGKQRPVIHSTKRKGKK